MAVAAVASGPISFFTSLGAELAISVSSLSFDTQGALVVPAVYAEATGWLQHLHRIGVIRPGTAPTPTPAVVFRAVDPGSVGNSIQIKITYTAADTFDAEVTVRSEYAGLSVDTLVPTLGTPSAPGTRRGLVRVVAPAGGVRAPVSVTDTLAGGAANAASALPVDAAAGGEAFTLHASKVGTEGDLIEVTVTAHQSTFDLTAEWKKTRTGLTGSYAANFDGAFGFFVTASAPPGGTVALPGEGVVVLSGGVDSAAAVATAVARAT